MLDNVKQSHAFPWFVSCFDCNMVVGAQKGYKKELELVGVGTVFKQW